MIRQIACMHDCLMHQQWVIELKPGTINSSAATVATVRYQRIMKGAFSIQLKAGLRAHAGLITATEPVCPKIMRPHQRKHQHALSYEIAWHPGIQQGHAMVIVAVVHPVLSGKLDSGRPFKRAKRDLLHVMSLLYRCRKQYLVSNILFPVN